MSKGIETLFRLLGAVLGAAILGLIVQIVGDAFPELSEVLPMAITVAAVVGAIIGLIIAPRPIKQTQLALSSMTSDQLGAVLFGGLLAVVAGALLAVPLSYLPGLVGQVLPIVVAAALVYVGVSVLRERPNDFAAWLASSRSTQVVATEAPTISAEMEAIFSGVLLDTSVIIDGRITDISKTGFLTATFIVPNFVLSELQNIADSPDPIRRKRGRRGLEVLNVLRTESPIPFEISDMDVSEVREVDAKLVALARHTGQPIMTNDYNLNRVAGLQGVTVLNINDLANAVKAAYLPGEELNVRVIQEGREQNQGVGYLDDGTMVVVENGRNHLDDQLFVVVTKVLQTSAGRMIFARVP